MALNHSTVEEVCFLLVLDDTECAINILKPLFHLAELEVFYTARCGNQLDLRNVRSQCETVELVDSLNAIISEPLLNVGIKCASLKETVTQK